MATEVYIDVKLFTVAIMTESFSQSFLEEKEKEIKQIKLSNRQYYENCQLCQNSHHWSNFKCELMYP